MEFPTMITFLLSLAISSSSTTALNVGPTADLDIGKEAECSRKCESDFCSVAPLLRYGKYCGILYGGCPGEKPCDGIDACCMAHDHCIDSKDLDYLSTDCSSKFLDCIGAFRGSDAELGPTFEGNKCAAREVVDVMNVVIEAALFAGRVLHKP